jgi:ABC-type spermidine/putrescine transport system permease subunit II
MKKKDILTKGMAIVGTILVWFTLLAPVLLWVIFSIRRGFFNQEYFDYLMPAELFPLALVGVGFLLWAALRTRRRVKLILVSLCLALLALFGGQALAVVTGLASGETEPGGWQWALVLTSLGIYILTLVILGVGGLLLIRDPREKEAVV